MGFPNSQITKQRTPVISLESYLCLGGGVHVHMCGEAHVSVETRDEPSVSSLRTPSPHWLAGLFVWLVG